MMQLQRLRKWIKSWWHGEPLPYRPAVLELPRYQRHWTSHAAHAVVAFYLKEWRWLLPFMVAVLGAVVAIYKL